MAKLNPELLCFNCMGRLSAPGEKCPHCGYDNQNRANAGVFLSASVLNGQYFVGRALGRGGFGVTYLGYDLNLWHKVAIKEYFPMSLAMRTGDRTTILPYPDSEEQFEWGRKRALDEGRMTANLDQVPNAVRVYNAFEENGTAYIVMQYIEGKTLTRMVKDDGPMPWAQAYGLIRPIMRALEAIHAQGVIHRDVSPDNIMLRENSTSAVLLDFGAARSYADEMKGLTAMLRPGYAPPEQYSSTSKQDGRTDEYALCATLYFLLTGVTPPSSDQIAYSETQLSTPRSLGANIPEAAEAALMKGMSPRMEDRYPSIADLRAAFDAAGSGGEYLSTSVYPGPTSGAPRQGVRALLAVALTAVLVAGGFFAGMKLTGGKQTPNPQENREAPAAVIETETPTVAPAEEATPTPTPVLLFTLGPKPETSEDLTEASSMVPFNADAAALMTYLPLETVLATETLLPKIEEISALSEKCEFEPNANYDEYTYVYYLLEDIMAELYCTVSRKVVDAATGTYEYCLECDFYGDHQKTTSIYDGINIEVTYDKTGFMIGDTAPILDIAIANNVWFPIGK